MLLTGLLLAGVLPVLIAFSGENRAALDPRLLLWYALPVLVMTAILYDYHPFRRGLYFWGGAAVIATSLYALTK